jgi:hypothetical protein
MLKSKAFHFSLGGVIGAAVILVAVQFAPCSAGSLMILNMQRLQLPCPGSSVAPQSAGRDLGKVTVQLAIPPGSVVRVGGTFAVTLEVNTSGTAVNALDVTIAYPSSSVQLIAKNESMSPFTIHLGESHSGVSNETIQVQPNPGIASSATIARLTFRALRAGSVTFTIASSSEVLANDGSGTDVLGSLQNASITIQ